MSSDPLAEGINMAPTLKETHLYICETVSGGWTDCILAFWGQIQVNCVVDLGCQRS